MSTRGYPTTQAMRTERRATAERRNATWAELGPAKQIECLDNRLGGKGVGAKRQRARLAKALRRAQLG